jgi:hypothetical protein
MYIKLNIYVCISSLYIRITFICIYIYVYKSIHYSAGMQALAIERVQRDKKDIHKYTYKYLYVYIYTYIYVYINI